MTAQRQNCPFNVWAGSDGGIGDKKCSRGKNRTDSLGVQRGRLQPVATGGRLAGASAPERKQPSPAGDSIMGLPYAQPGPGGYSSGWVQANMRVYVCSPMCAGRDAGVCALVCMCRHV